MTSICRDLSNFKGKNNVQVDHDIWHAHFYACEQKVLEKYNYSCEIFLKSSKDSAAKQQFREEKMNFLREMREIDTHKRMRMAELVELQCMKELNDLYAIEGNILDIEVPEKFASLSSLRFNC
jgi:hypothetical protein